MNDEHEKSRMKKTTNNLTSLISSLDLRSEKTNIEEYVQLAAEEIVDGEYIRASWWIIHGVQKSIWV